MGDPRKAKQMYENPAHPWQKARIEAEKELVREFALKNKTEIYRHAAQIKRFVDNFKILNVLTNSQAMIEKEQLQKRAIRLGFLASDSELSAILDMTVKNALSRRLQTIVFKRKLARSIKQARQFITHRHILVDGQVIDAPGYIVPVEAEHNISFIQRSPFVSEMHPERVVATADHKDKKHAKDSGADEMMSAPVEIKVEEASDE